MKEKTHQAVKAYRNSSFLDSSDARPLRILAEYLEPESRFRYSAPDHADGTRIALNECFIAPHQR